MKVFIFGENPNDSKALKELVLGLRADLTAGDVRTLREPPTLVRGSGGRAVRSWAEKAAQALRGTRISSTEIACVLAHTDADGPDDGSFAERRTAELRSAGLVNAVAVVPVQAIESWWLLFAPATESVVAGWSGALSKKAFNTDSVDKPKDELIRRTRAKANRRPYTEADSPDVARAVAAGHIDAPQRANSPSFERFRAVVESCS